MSVQYARTLLRLPDVEKWNREKASSVTMTPWSMHKETPPDVGFPEREIAEGDVRPDAIRQVRRVYIRQGDLDTYGYTTGCPKCEDILRGASKSTLNHSDRCGTRIIEELAKTSDGRIRIGAATERSH